MVSKKIGVIGIQGAIAEHINSFEKAINELNFNAEVFSVRNKDQIKSLDALVIPGGESTTISRFIQKLGLEEEILRRIKKKDLPIMGTCAGCVILANSIKDETHDVKLLKAMDMTVKRNAFGRQKESFEQKIDIKGLNTPYNAVFIRAPTIEDILKDCKALAKIDNKIVMARQDNLLALSFHPELTDDLRIHKYFLDII